MSFHQLTAVGRLGRDPEFRTVGQKRVCNFSIAVDTYEKGAKGTMWIGVESWNERQQKVIEDFVVKGGEVMIQGTPRVNLFQTRDGSTNAELRCDISWGSLTLVGGKKQSEDRVPDRAADSGRSSRESSSQQREREERRTTTSTAIDDDIPF
jgi:single-strand DNA-binding protein